MSFLDDTMTVATRPPPGAAAPEAGMDVFDALPIAALAAQWQSLQHLGLKDQTEQSRVAAFYFEHLPHEAPERALDLVLDVLKVETDRSVLIALTDQILCMLVHRHAHALIDRIEVAAVSQPQLAFLLGGVVGWAGDQAIEARLARIADPLAWRAAERRQSRGTRRIAYRRLDTAALARAWVEQRGKPAKDRDDNWHDLIDYERDLLDRDPDAVIDLVLGVLAIETHPAVLALLAAGPLEDVLGLDTIERIEREAAAHPRFRTLLGSVASWNAPADLRRRLDAVVAGAA